MKRHEWIALAALLFPVAAAAGVAAALSVWYVLMVRVYPFIMAATHSA